MVERFRAFFATRDADYFIEQNKKQYDAGGEVEKNDAFLLSEMAKMKAKYDL
jgi:hypothetical protein